MSISTHRELNCPGCAAVSSFPVWSSITVSEHPEIRKRILDEAFFDFKCKNCGYVADYYYPCLYHDMEKGFMLYLNPSVNVMNIQLPDKLGSLKKRLISSKQEMKEKILIFESGFDDVAMEIVKLAARNIICKKTGITEPQIFFVNGGQDQMIFEVFEKKGVFSGVKKMKTALYKEASDMLRELSFRDPDNFLKADKELAQNLLLKFQSKQGADK